MKDKKLIGSAFNGPTQMYVSIVSRQFRNDKVPVCKSSKSISSDLQIWPSFIAVIWDNILENYFDYYVKKTYPLLPDGELEGSCKCLNSAHEPRTLRIRESSIVDC